MPCIGIRDSGPRGQIISKSSSSVSSSNSWTSGISSRSLLFPSSRLGCGSALGGIFKHSFSPFLYKLDTHRQFLAHCCPTKVLTRRTRLDSIAVALGTNQSIYLTVFESLLAQIRHWASPCGY